MFSESGFFDPDKPIRDYTRDRAPRLPLQGARQGQDQRHQPDLRGAGPADPEVVPVQGRRRAAAAHPRLRRAGGDVQRLPRLRRHPAQRGGAIVEDRRDQHRRRLRDADQRPGRVGARPRRAVGRAAAGGARGQPRLVRRDGPGLPQPRPAVGHAVGRRGAAHPDDPPPRVVADRRHLRLRRADDRAARPRRRADERAAPAPARQGQHGPRRRARPGGDPDRRPRRRHGPGRRSARRDGRVRGHGRRPHRVGHGHRPPPRRPAGAEAGAARAARLDPDPERAAPQPQGRLGRRAARRARRGDRASPAPARAR